MKISPIVILLGIFDQALSSSFHVRGSLSFLPRGGGCTNDTKPKHDYGNNYDDVIGGNAFDDVSFV